METNFKDSYNKSIDEYNTKLNNFKEEFKKLGYNTDNMGIQYFYDLVTELGEYKEMPDEDLENIIPNIELEYYHFIYGIPKYKYKLEIQNFLDSGVFKTNGDEDINNEIIFFTKYFNNINDCKQYVKNKK